MRTVKTGLDYFPMDVDFFDDEKVEFISAKYDILGENVCIKLLCRIYRNGYFMPWGEDECLLFAKRAGNQLTYEIVQGVVEELCKRGFFSQHHYERFQVLTSNGIQKRFLEATRRRKKVSMRKELIIADIKDYNVNIIPFNDGNSTQRKGKESKEKKNIPQYIVPPLGQFNNVHLTSPELQKLTNQLGNKTALQKIEDLSSYIASKGKRYKSHYATILTWVRRDGGNGDKQAPDPSWTCRNCHQKAEFLKDGICQECENEK